MPPARQVVAPGRGRDASCPATGRLPSTTSATGKAGFVRCFTGTMLAVRPLASSAAASPSRLPAVARNRQWRLRARRGLPASNAILLCVTWPSTPAGRRLLHSEGARVAFDAFDRLGSRDVPHFVAHSHTPHNCCVRFVAPVADGSRNTRYQAGATPYLGRTSTGWIAPASAGAFRKRESKRTAKTLVPWIPAFAGMTNDLLIFRPSF